jgi:hypothetical protein
MMKGLARLTSLVVVWGSVQGLHGQAPTAPDPLLDPYVSQEHSVTIDGNRRIHLVCMGAGTPTVVLSAGRGDWSVTWSRVRASHFENTDLGSRPAVNPARNYGSMPLVVLSAPRQTELPPGLTPERQALLRAEARATFADDSKGHEELAVLSSIGIRKLVPNVGHFIQADNPDVVIEAIAGIVEAARLR